ncbi:MAG: aminotransferase class IV [Bryobacterales bacterium]|nr:aminotransferase class IV [Bryobacterales bacterium]
MKALHNDRLIPKDQTKVQLDTVAFKYAAMVFEGIRAYWNETEEQLFVFRLGDHARRLENSVRIMRMDTRLMAKDYSSAVLRVLEANAIRQDAHIRQMVYVDGPGEMFGTGPVSHSVVAIPKGRWFSEDDAGIHVCVSSWQRISDSSLPPRVKCAANYQNGRLALLQAREDGYEGAIVLNSFGKVSEEPRGCVFMVKGGRVSTPKVTNDILESITRDTLMALFRNEQDVDVAERDIDRTELYLADELFICGSGLEVTPVLSIDRHQISNGKPGEMTTAIRKSYLKAVHGELAQYRHWLSKV